MDRLLLAKLSRASDVRPRQIGVIGVEVYLDTPETFTSINGTDGLEHPHASG